MKAAILDQLAAAAKKRVQQNQLCLSLAELQAQVLALPKKDFAFEKSLAKPGLNFICECKKASPSKGLIQPDYNPVRQARYYEQAGAAAISVLTEPTGFQGRDKDLQQVRASTTLPILRKDFVVDPYMIYQARLLGADAILLIVALLSDKQLKEYLQLADQLGLSALVEVHNENELTQALQAKARLIGINNRNLKDFSVNPQHAADLASLLPANIIKVSESGIKNASQVAQAAENGFQAVLIGETLMKAADPAQMLIELRSQL